MSSNRYFLNTESASQPLPDTFKELLESLDRINTHNPPVQTCSTGWTFHGLYTGPLSISYLFYRLHTLYPDLEFKSQSLLDWAQAYLELSTHVPKPDPDPDHCGIANDTLAYCALRAVMSGDPSLAAQLCSYRSVVNAVEGRTGSNEWLYGRAGYLYFLRLARSVFTAEQFPSTHKQLTDAIGATVERVLEIPLPWIWHGSEYLGAAHGVVGIVCQLVLSDATTAPRLRDLLARTLALQYPSGNFPSSLPVSASDKLIQFCHGGPGFILSLESVRPFFPDLQSQVDDTIAKAREDVWARGLLTKESCLCHGIAGNALVLEDHDQMLHFLAHTTSKELEDRGWMQKAGQSDKFASLYTGEAGRAWTWAVVDRDLKPKCIGYNDV